MVLHFVSSTPDHIGTELFGLEYNMTKGNPLRNGFNVPIESKWWKIEESFHLAHHHEDKDGVAFLRGSKTA